MKKTAYFLSVLFVMITNLALAQSHAEKCATPQMHARNLQKTPGLAARIALQEEQMKQWVANHPTGKTDASPAIITVPVVVHVIYHNAAENISDSQILSQIAVLNADYRKQNSDTLPTSNPYHQFIADAGFEFCLASRDPNDSATTGITRTLTSRPFFNPDTDADDYMKFTTQGGIDAWDPHQYLNIWVVNIDSTNGTLGYTSYPTDLADYPDYDGCVIDYHYFGNTGPAVQAPLDLGRTTTHEVGHWLNLIHIWGDDYCASDSVADTPTQEDSNFGCPNFPHVTCSNGPNGDMFMNYMDYVDDGCMNMFTTGQVSRMQAAFSEYRTSILSSQGCQSIVNTGVTNVATVSVQVIPNPSNGVINVKLNGFTGKATMTLYDLMGREIWNNNADQGGTNVVIRVDNAVSGVYLLKIKAGNETLTQMVIVN